MINNILSKYRRLKVKQDLIEDVLKITFFLISFLSFFMFLEYVFFLEKIVRYRVFLTLISFTLIFFAYIVIKIILNLKGINQKFSNEKLAQEIGYKIPSFSDRLINILQLSKIQHANKTKKELAKIAISKNELELEKVDLNTIIIKLSSKKIISSISFLLTFVFLLFFMTDFSNAIVRIYNYDKEYLPPLPFTIIDNKDSNEIIY